MYWKSKLKKYIFTKMVKCAILSRQWELNILAIANVIDY